MVLARKHVNGLLVLAALMSILAANAPAQQPVDTVGSRHLADSTNHTTRKHYWRNFGAGIAVSVLAHEAGHVGMSYVLGAPKPSDSRSAQRLTGRSV